MPYAEPSYEEFDPEAQSSPSVKSTNELLDQMNGLLTAVATNLPHIKLSVKDHSRVINLMDRLAKDRDSLSTDLSAFTKEVISTNKNDIDVNLPIGLYGCIIQYNSKLEVHACNFAGHMSSLSAINGISNIL